MENNKLESFISAFHSRSSGCRRMCDCGKEYYDVGNDDYDWGEGELEALERDPEAIPLDYSVGTIYLEGKEYVIDCDCWKDRAKKIISWLENNDYAIADFLRLEKERFSLEAAQKPLVEEGWLHMDSAPKDGRNITIKTESDEIVKGHFAQDLSGEFQPMFKGWFTEYKGHSDYMEIKPKQWKIK